jgi:hypothetical protein
MPRFVVLEHDHPQLHWDFMLEAGAVLRTWRLATPPQAGQAVAASASFDHRLHYLDYEGPVSGQRGNVQRWDGGIFTWQVDAADRLVVLLEGQRLRGRVVLSKTGTGQWSLTSYTEMDRDEA